MQYYSHFGHTIRALSCYKAMSSRISPELRLSLLPIASFQVWIEGELLARPRRTGASRSSTPDLAYRRAAVGGARSLKTRRFPRQLQRWLCDVDLNDIWTASEERQAGLFWHPSALTYHLSTWIARVGARMRTWERADFWINGGYFLLRRSFEYMRTARACRRAFQRWRREQLMAYKHEGFWRSMDT